MYFATIILPNGRRKLGSASAFIAQKEDTLKSVVTRVGKWWRGQRFVVYQYPLGGFFNEDSYKIVFDSERGGDYHDIN